MNSDTCDLPRRLVRFIQAATKSIGAAIFLIVCILVAGFASPSGAEQAVGRDPAMAALANVVDAHREARQGCFIGGEPTRQQSFRAPADEGAQLVQYRNQGCPPGTGNCNGYCIPTSAICCGNGRYCSMGSNCCGSGCCANGTSCMVNNMGQYYCRPL